MPDMSSEVKDSSEWLDATADNPCPVCWRSEGCRIRAREVACVLIENDLGKHKTSKTGESYCLYDLSTFRYVLVPDDLPLIGGGFADARSGSRIEVFPKCDELAFGEAEAARLLSLHPHQLRDARLREEIEASVGPGRRILYSRQDLLTYLANRRWTPAEK